MTRRTGRRKTEKDNDYAHDFSFASLRHAALGLRRDSRNARTAGLALTLGMAAHPDDAASALEYARSRLAPLGAALLDYVREVEVRATSWTEDMLDARVSSVATYSARMG